MDTDAIDNLSYLEDGNFAKIYKGHLVINKLPVTIKVPRVPPEIRKEKSKWKQKNYGWEIFVVYEKISFVKTYQKCASFEFLLSIHYLNFLFNFLMNNL